MEVRAALPAVLKILFHFVGFNFFKYLQYLPFYHLFINWLILLFFKAIKIAKNSSYVFVFFFFFFNVFHGCDSLFLTRRKCNLHPCSSSLRPRVSFESDCIEFISKSFGPRWILFIEKKATETDHISCYLMKHVKWSFRRILTAAPN